MRELVVLESNSLSVLTGSCFFAHFHAKSLPLNFAKF